MPERVVAYHLVITAYGFWLPNDPRGSWSDFVRSWELYWYGAATKTVSRRNLARDAHDRNLRLIAKTALKRLPVAFDGRQALAISRGFASYAGRSGCAIHACSILPAHVHLVVGRHTCSIEQVARLLKQAATGRLLEEGLHPFGNERYADRRCPPPWTRGEWSVFLGAEGVAGAVEYVEQNPVKEGKKPQHWSFVVPWPAHSHVKPGLATRRPFTNLAENHAQRY